MDILLFSFKFCSFNKENTKKKKNKTVCCEKENKVFIRNLLILKIVAF